MKLIDKDKLQIYQLRKQGVCLKNYDINTVNLDYLFQLIDRYGIESVKKEKSFRFSSVKVGNN